jgi:Dynein heavy chain C-terminal domain
MCKETPAQLTSKPASGVYITGLFLEGARWDAARGGLVDPRPKELFSAMPVMHLAPEKDRAAPASGIYRCPVYKVSAIIHCLTSYGTAVVQCRRVVQQTAVQRLMRCCCDLRSANCLLAAKSCAFSASRYCYY